MAISDVNYQARRGTPSAGTMGAYLLLRILGSAGALDPVATLDHIGFQAYRAWTAVQLEEEPAGIAQHRTDLVSPPERRGGGGAILAGGLGGVTINISHGCHDLELGETQIWGVLEGRLRLSRIVGDER